MCVAPCDVARFDFACDLVSEKSPYDLGRYIAGMNLPQTNMGTLMATCMIVKEWTSASGVEMLQGATSASPLKCSRAIEVRKVAFESAVSALPPFAEDPNDAFQTAQYLLPVILNLREPSLVAAFLSELLGYKGGVYDDFCFGLDLFGGTMPSK